MCIRTYLPALVALMDAMSRRLMIGVTVICGLILFVDEVAAQTKPAGEGRSSDLQQKIDEVVEAYQRARTAREALAQRPEKVTEEEFNEANKLCDEYDILVFEYRVPPHGKVFEEFPIIPVGSWKEYTRYKYMRNITWIEVEEVLAKWRARPPEEDAPGKKKAVDLAGTVWIGDCPGDIVMIRKEEWNFHPDGTLVRSLYTNVGGLEPYHVDGEDFRWKQSGNMVYIVDSSFKQLYRRQWSGEINGDSMGGRVWSKHGGSLTTWKVDMKK